MFELRIGDVSIVRPSKNYETGSTKIWDNSAESAGSIYSEIVGFRFRNKNA